MAARDTQRTILALRWKQRKENGTGNAVGRPRKHKQEADTSHDDACFVCGHGGEVMLCDHCDHVYHLRCLSPPLSVVPDGEWICPQCANVNDDDPMDVDDQEEPNPLAHFEKEIRLHQQ